MARSQNKAPADPSFPEWLKGRLRFGLADDCVILFVPSHARDKKRLKDQSEWASQALDLMGKLYGGGTGFTDLRGIWRDDENGGELLDDEPIMIQSLAKREDVEDPEKIGALATFLKRMGNATNQGAVAVVLTESSIRKDMGVAVGWVERSETHQRGVVGRAQRDPPYTDGSSFCRAGLSNNAIHFISNYD